MLMPLPAYVSMWKRVRACPIVTPPSQPESVPDAIVGLGGYSQGVSVLHSTEPPLQEWKIWQGPRTNIDRAMVSNTLLEVF